MWWSKILIYFLPAILIIGIITSYEDIRFGKIRNKWVILALLYAFAMYSTLILFYLSKGGIKSEYLMELGTNIFFSMVVGFGLWYMGVWTAGDGKLFIAYSALIPLSSYSQSYQKWIPSSMLLMNVFVLGLVVMVIVMLFKTRIKDMKKVSIGFLSEFFKPKQLLNSIIHLFAIFWVVGILLSLIGLGNNSFLNIILTIFILSAMQNKLGDKALYLPGVISLLRFFVDKSVYSLSFLIDFLILIFIWRFVRSFLRGSISKLGQEMFSKELGVSKLKPGMVLSEIIVKKDEKEIKKIKKWNTQIFKYKGEYYIKTPKTHLELDNFIEEEAEGLTKMQIEKIKKIGIEKIKISQTIPFAPFIFLGVILTIIFKGNILIVLMALF